MESHAHQGIWGEEFHFLPFVSIMGASTIGAVNASMAMARDGVPGTVGIIFLIAWGIVTCMLLVAGNQLFCRKNLASKLNRTAVARTGSGAVCVLVTLFAVWGTYSAVSSVSGAQARTVVAAPATTPEQTQTTAPLQVMIAKTTGAGSVHYQTSSKPYLAEGELPAPIAPPAGELVSLPEPASIIPSQQDTFGEQDAAEASVASKPSRKITTKRPIRKITKPSGPKTIVATPTKPVTFSTVDSAAAPAPTNQLRDLNNIQSGSNFSGNGSSGCSSKTCLEKDANR